ncbi:MAG: glycosyltransferase family 39 protein [Planctomycetes bacterium]|nr:glycosyltransferase family 39 protein [Planctomycetota bacterium]
MQIRRPLAIVLVASIASLALGIAATPFWDEDEPRFAAIARTMVDTGDWVVPMFNDELAVDKPVLMHWAMAVAYTLFGTSEIVARLPAALATLLTALALLRAGTRWFDPTTGVVAALAYVGSLLVGIESHAATPDAILTALVTWATVLCAEPLLAAAGGKAAQAVGALPRLTGRRAAAIGGLLGLAVLCKGPIGFVGPLAVVLPWTWWLAIESRLATTEAPTLARRLLPAVLPAVWETLQTVRLGIITVAMLAVAAPWYTAVSLRTDGAWINGFFFIHNVGRFVAPMEQHGGGVFFHPLAMLVGFYPWSCFLPLAVIVTAWRVWRRADPPARRQSLALVLFWMAVWVGGFSASATKLPNYVLPAYPAAALLVAAAGVLATRQAWIHPRWMAAGTASLALGGIATATAVLVATEFGLTGAEPAALVGLVPVVGAACIWRWRHEPLRAVAALAVTGLVFTGLAVGPAAARIAQANRLPALINEAHLHAGGHARLGTFTQITPNVVYYAHGHVQAWQRNDRADALSFLASGADAVVLVRDDDFAELSAALPAGVGIIGRARPLFHQHEFLLVGTAGTAATRTASLRSTKQ